MAAWAVVAAGVAHAAAFPARALVSASSWDDPGFLRSFRARGDPIPLAWKAWPRPGPVLGSVPGAVRARFVDGRIDCITLLFLDAGTYFGYVPRDKADEVRAAGEEDFRKRHAEVEAAVLAALEKTAAGPATTARIGRTNRMRQSVRVFPCGDLFARFQSVPAQLVKVTLFRTRGAAFSWMDPAVAAMATEGRTRARVAAVRTSTSGDRFLADIPLMPQGDRAYCGVSALAMVLQTLGLNVDTEDLAAAAGIRFGSTAGSKIMETYFAAATEGNFKFARADTLDMARVQATIDRGLPVIVWRRWSQERDYLHTQFARRLAADPRAQLPPADADDRAAWPKDRNFNHASVVTGYNARRGEILFTESWSESLRGRRMRTEEMAATSHCVFYARWREPDEPAPAPTIDGNAGPEQDRSFSPRRI